MVGKINNTIVFSYDSDKLFNDVSLLSAYMVKNLGNENGSLLDGFAITGDEKDVYEVCLSQTLPDIYEHIIKTTSGVTDAFKTETISADEGQTGLMRPKGTYVVVSVKDNEAYNENILSLVEPTLYDCIKYGTLSEFYSVNLNADLLSLARAKFNECLSQLNRRLFQLKKKSVKSLY